MSRIDSTYRALLLREVLSDTVTIVICWEKASADTG